MAAKKSTPKSKSNTAPKKSKAQSDPKTKKASGTRKFPLRVTDTTLRDAHQSLWNSRMRTRDIVEILDVIDNVGYYSLEVWGGDTFNACLNFLRENPWERLRQIKKIATKTPIQMLLRGQNVLGQTHYPDDVVDKFCQLACQNGMDIFRVFDALNDTRNVEKAIASAIRYGGHVQGTLCYTISPVHTVEKYVEYAKEQVALGIDSIVIKDMSGLLNPFAADKLVAALKKEIKVPIQLHTHCTSGMATATYVQGVEAGAGAIDCAISSMAGYTSQPPVETMLSIFEPTRWNMGLDPEALRTVCRYFIKLRDQRAPETYPPENVIDPEILMHHLPAGMISSIRSRLQNEKAMDRLQEVFEEIPRVRKDLGYPPLVTPAGQLIGNQAVVNVLSGKRYGKVSKEIKAYCRGLYGRPPAPIEPKLLRKIVGKQTIITCRPADKLKPGLPTATRNIPPALVENEEDILSYIIHPQPALDYFEWRALPAEDRESIPADIQQAQAAERTGTAAPADEPPTQPIMADSDYTSMQGLLSTIKDLGLTEFTVRRHDMAVSVKAEGVSTAYAAPSDHPSAQPLPETAGPKSDAAAAVAPVGPTINAPLNGNFYTKPGPDKDTFVSVGDTVKEGQVVCIVEAMKLFNDIKAPCDCTIVSFLRAHGDSVEKNEPLICYTEL